VCERRLIYLSISKSSIIKNEVFVQKCT